MPSDCTAILAVKNGTNYLREAISSIRAQTLPISRILVVDDHSTDNTVALCVELGIECYLTDGIGQAAATNLAITMSSAKFIAFLDHDDTWETQKTELQIQYLQDNPSALAVYSRVKNFYTDGSISHDFSPSRALGASLFRREIFQEVGLIQATLTSANILTWWSEVARCGIRVDSLDIPALNRRVHQSNFNRAHPEEAQRNLFSALRSQIRLGEGTK